MKRKDNLYKAIYNIEKYSKIISRSMSKHTKSKKSTKFKRVQNCIYIKNTSNISK